MKEEEYRMEESLYQEMRTFIKPIENSSDGAFFAMCLEQGWDSATLVDFYEEKDRRKREGLE